MTLRTNHLDAPRQIAIAMLLPKAAGIPRIGLLLCATAPGSLPLHAAEPDKIVATCAAIAEAAHADASAGAMTLLRAMATPVAAPSAETLAAAPRAWQDARVPCMQTEIFRFGNPVVDCRRGRVKARPLDKGRIDQVAGDQVAGENDPANLNVIATPTFTLAGVNFGAAEITPALISGTLHKANGIETGVASGWDAVEFPLWGQDLNGTGPDAGDRPFNDVLAGAGCAGGNCDRSAANLLAADDLLAAGMDELAEAAGPGDGARLTGMGCLCYGELAGERMQLSLMLNDPEQAQDCFSDNTHNGHDHDGLGIRNVCLGRSARPDGRIVTGPALTDLMASADPTLDAALKAEHNASIAAHGAIGARAETGMAHDQIPAPAMNEDRALLMAAVGTLVAQTASIQRAVTLLGLSGVTVEGSDSLDAPGVVFR